MDSVTRHTVRRCRRAVVARVVVVSRGGVRCLEGLKWSGERTGERGKADSLERSKERKERGNGAAEAEVGERRGSWEAGRQAGWLAF